VKIKYSLIAYFLTNISARDYQNSSIFVEAKAVLFFEKTVYMQILRFYVQLYEIT